MSGYTTALAYTTGSAGMHPSHTLPVKIHAIAEAGFTHVELTFPDLEAYAEQEFPGYNKLDDTGNGDLEILCKVAEKIRALCAELNTPILAVHPFSQYEGYEGAKKAQGLARARAWFKVLKALDCQMLQVGSNNDPSSSSDYYDIAGDLQKLADEAAAQDPPISIAYEMWAWGCYVNTWEHTWEVCKRVNRPNFGLCLDTFQIAARTYADPTSKNGLLSKPTSATSTATTANSLKNLSETIKPEKIFYFQISDGARVNANDIKQQAKEQGIDPLYVWSNAWRPIPFMDEIEGVSGEQSYRGYLPVVDVIEAVLKTGWRGPWSHEVFYAKDMSRAASEVPKKWTLAAKLSQEKIEQELRKRGL